MEDIVERAELRQIAIGIVDDIDADWSWDGRGGNEAEAKEKVRVAIINALLAEHERCAKIAAGFGFVVAQAIREDLDENVMT